MAQLLELELKCKRWYPLSSAPAYFDTLADAGAQAAKHGRQDAVGEWIAAQVDDIQRQVFDMPLTDGACPEIFRPPPGSSVVLAIDTFESSQGKVQCLVVDS